MATGEARNVKYASATYGSLAYNMGAVAQPKVLPRELPKEETRSEVQVRPRTAERAKIAVSPLAVVGMLAAAFLLTLIVVSYMHLAILSSEGAGLKENLDKLTTEQTKLKIQYESTFDLAQVEQYASSQLGMVKGSDGQICYVDHSEPDKAVILTENRKSVWQSVSAFFAVALEYFR